MRKYFVLVALFVLLFLVMPSRVLAADNNYCCKWADGKMKSVVVSDSESSPFDKCMEGETVEYAEAIIVGDPKLCVASAGGCCEHIYNESNGSGGQDRVSEYDFELDDVSCYKKCYKIENAECDFDENIKKDECESRPTKTEAMNPSEGYGCCEVVNKADDGKTYTAYWTTQDETMCLANCGGDKGSSGPCKYDDSVKSAACGAKQSTADNTAGAGETPFVLGVDASVLNQLSSTDVKTVIGSAIKAGMGLMGSIALAMFIYGGVLWMSSAGNAERSKKGMQVILWAALGMFMILTSYAVVSFVFEAFK